MDRYARSMPYNMIHLCIDEYNDYTISGRAYNTTREDPIEFQDFMDLILKMDDIFDENGNPLSSRQTRSFQKSNDNQSYQFKPESLCQYQDLEVYKGKQATFDIVIKRRTQSSWQGILFFQDEEYSFQTALEMIQKVMDYLK